MFIMIKNRFLTMGVLGLLLVGLSSAVSVNYFYSPSCGHCKEITPFIQQISSKYNDVDFNFLDITKGSYNIRGTPTLIINTKDKREIILVGSYEIPKLLECELNEMSVLDCSTTPYLNATTNSYFIR